MAEVIKGSSGKRRGKTTEALSTEKRKRKEEDLDLNLSRSVCVFGLKISLKLSYDVFTYMQTFVKALSKSSKECGNSLKGEFAKFHSVYEKFSKEKAAHLQAFEDIFSKFDNEKEKLYLPYEQQRKKEKSMLSEIEKTCADKITASEESLKKKKKDNKSFSILRKSLGSFLDGASDDDLIADECL
ncbi:hypothetical protein MKX01_008228 [Papaver californicum]|nr:hypothetical protein MKX01_008228 [Papaver californicum]